MFESLEPERVEQNEAERLFEKFSDNLSKLPFQSNWAKAPGKKPLDKLEANVSSERVELKGLTLEPF